MLTKSLIFFGSCLCFAFVYLVIDTKDYNYYATLRISIHPRLISALSSSLNNDEDQLSTCRLPVVDPWNDEIIKYFDATFDENGACIPSKLTELKEGKIIVKDENLTCWTKCAEYISDFTVKIDDAWKEAGVKLECEAILTHCSYNESVEAAHYAKIHTQVVERNAHPNTTTTTAQPTPTNSSSTTAEGPPSKNVISQKKYNVFIVVIDSTAMSQAERVYMKTLSYMRNYMKAISFPFFNKVGVNSYPNGMPLFTGIQIEPVRRGIFGLPDLPASKGCIPYHLDNTTHLYKVFREEGYKTMAAENWGLGVASWPNCKAFKDPPADHTLNTAYRLHQQVKSTSPFVDEGCFWEFAPMLGYWSHFLNSYKGQPKFGMLWESVQAHNYENGAISSDTPFLDFLVKNRQTLDDSFIIFTADHGLRFGWVASSKTGARENNNPMLTIALPKDLRNNTELVETIRQNSQKLQTMWDIRATVFDILQSQSDNFTDFSLVLFENGFGSSVFRRQEGPRTCKTMPIPFPFCICDIPREPLDPNSDEALDLGVAAISEVNHMINNMNITQLCHKWEFDKVVSAEIIGNREAFEITVETKSEHHAKFKMMLRRLSKDEPLFEGSSIDRQDEYKDRGKCAGEFGYLCECLK